MCKHGWFLWAYPLDWEQDTGKSGVGAAFCASRCVEGSVLPDLPDLSPGRVSGPRTPGVPAENRPSLAHSGGSSHGGAQKLATARRSEVVSGSWWLCCEPLDATLTLSGSRVAFLPSPSLPAPALKRRWDAAPSRTVLPGPPACPHACTPEPRPQPEARGAGQEAAGPG